MSRRFLPSIDQVKRAGEELPDPMKYEGEECTVNVKSGDAERELVFKKFKFSAGGGKSIYRWVYEGKAMIRNLDGYEKSRKKEKEDETVVFSLSIR